MSEEKKQDSKKSVEVEQEQTLSTEEILKKNLQWSQIIYKQNKQIKRRLNLMVWGGILKWALILAPIILGIIYLPPLIKPLLEQYSGLLGIAGGLGKEGAVSGGLDINQIIKNLSPEQMGAITKMLGGGR